MCCVEGVTTLKSESARQACLALNSSSAVQAYNVRFTVDNALDLASSYDTIVDCSDNLPTRYLINDTGYLLSKPIVSGSALGLEGRLSVYLPTPRNTLDSPDNPESPDSPESGKLGERQKQQPCLRCLHPNPPPASSVPSCSDAGIYHKYPLITLMNIYIHSYDKP